MTYRFKNPITQLFILHPCALILLDKAVGLRFQFLEGCLGDQLLIAGSHETFILWAGSVPFSAGRSALYIAGIHVCFHQYI